MDIKNLLYIAHSSLAFFVKQNINTVFVFFLVLQVRQVSNHILSTQDQNVEGDSQYTALITFFGQLNDHDLSFTPISPSIRSFSNGIRCDESCERSEPCFPIQVRAFFY